MPPKLTKRSKTPGSGKVSVGAFVPSDLCCAVNDGKPCGHEGVTGVTAEDCFAATEVSKKFGKVGTSREYDLTVRNPQSALQVCGSCAFNMLLANHTHLSPSVVTSKKFSGYRHISDLLGAHGHKRDAEDAADAADAAAIRKCVAAAVERHNSPSIEVVPADGLYLEAGEYAYNGSRGIVKGNRDFVRLYLEAEPYLCRRDQLEIVCRWEMY